MSPEKDNAQSGRRGHGGRRDPEITSPTADAPRGTRRGHLVRCASGIDVRGILEEVEERPGLWLEDTSRQRNVKCQRHTQTIFLRAAAKPLPPGANNANDVHACRTLRAARLLPRSLAFCREEAGRLGGELGRAMLVALLPGGRVDAHVDHGAYYRARDRFHLVLKSTCGSPLTAGGETAVLQVGELWVLNNKVRHAAWNESGEPRIHLIFDVVPGPGRGFFAAPTCSSEGMAAADAGRIRQEPSSPTALRRWLRAAVRYGRDWRAG